MKELGVYIHIPFCKQKCIYCDFISFAEKEELQEQYVKALKSEIQNWIEQNKEYGYKFKTIYIGGGTPSYIDSKYIAQILYVIKKSVINEEKNISITIEANPGTLTVQKLKDYKNAGINRLSIGLQSTNNEILKELGRIHSYEDFLETYKLAREVGFENINVDLMIGLPNQGITDIKETLEKVTKLNPNHISVYSLIIEETTPIQRLIDFEKIKLPDEEIERRMYWYVKDYLELEGYKQYEISNYAKPGFESIHNLDCWEQKEYIGFGLAAHSYIDNKRFSNIINLEEYIENCENKEFEKNIIIQEIQTKENKMKEYMILGLRKLDGISIQRFENIFNENPIMIFRNELNKLTQEELILIDGDIIKLSNKGLDLANIVWEEFV